MEERSEKFELGMLVGGFLTFGMFAIFVIYCVCKKVLQQKVEADLDSETIMNRYQDYFKVKEETEMAMDTSN